MGSGVMNGFEIHFFALPRALGITPGAHNIVEEYSLYSQEELLQGHTICGGVLFILPRALGITPGAHNIVEEYFALPRDRRITPGAHNAVEEYFALPSVQTQ